MPYAAYIRLCMVQFVKRLGDLKAFPRDSRACPEKMLYLSQRLPKVISHSLGAQQAKKYFSEFSRKFLPRTALVVHQTKISVRFCIDFLCLPFAQRPVLP